MSFAANIRAALPAGMNLPEPFAQTFDWLEAQGWHGVFANHNARDFENHYLSIYPPKDRDTHGASYVLFSFEAGPPFHAPPPEVIARVATLGKIAGDGGTLSLWLDEEGKQWCVVFNHGQPHVLTDDPLKALLFLAIGYREPAALDDVSLTATDYAAREGYDPPILPEAYRSFLTETFGVTIPERASDLGITIPAEGDPDPLRIWLEAVIPPPDPATILGLTAENPFIIDAETAALLGDEGLQAMRNVYDHVIVEEQ